jgi:hypothetical protein
MESRALPQRRSTQMFATGRLRTPMKPFGRAHLSRRWGGRGRSDAESTFARRGRNLYLVEEGSARNVGRPSQGASATLTAENAFPARRPD